MIPTDLSVKMPVPLAVYEECAQIAWGQIAWDWIEPDDEPL